MDVATLWKIPPENLVLSNEEAHIWHVSLDIPIGARLSLWEILSDDELRRARQFYFDEDAQHFVTARSLLRLIISFYLNVAPDELRFQYGPRGKPYLANQVLRRSLSFNLSHSDGQVLYVIASQGRSVGIDLERFRPNYDYRSVAERFFTSKEKDRLSSGSDSENSRTFFQYWVRKEAYIKARGHGLSIPLDSFDVSRIGETHLVSELREEGLYDETNHFWTIRDLSLEDSFVGAVAIVGENPKLRLWRFTF